MLLLFWSLFHQPPLLYNTTSTTPRGVKLLTQSQHVLRCTIIKASNITQLTIDTNLVTQCLPDTSPDYTYLKILNNLRSDKIQLDPQQILTYSQLVLVHSFLFYKNHSLPETFTHISQNSQDKPTNVYIIFEI